MLFALIILLVVVAGEVSGLTPRRPPSKCLSPAARDKVKPQKCGPNSYFERCSKVCPPQNCSTLLDPNWLCESKCCVPECRCYDGYLRDDRTGRCISRDECLAQCGPSERFVNESMDCQRTCANYKVTGPRSLCKPFTGCVCDEGRVRLNDNATGACVLPQQCPPRQCPLNEHWEKCPSVCAKETCISKNPEYKCLLPAIPLPCKPRCICNKGYLRNHLGECIPENHCPLKRCPTNEVWRCASTCSRDSCKRLEPGFRCPPGIMSVCIPACACKDGFLRNEKGTCIPQELCRASRCGINEIAVKCKSYLPQTCESIYTLYRPIENPPCIPGCDCRSGYLRNSRNICVPSEFCPTVPQNECGPNQEYKECGSSCAPSCADLDNPPRVCPEVCIKGCFCKDGYRKDDQGNCVTRDQCPLPVCYKPNEVAKDCGSYCEIKTCEDYNRTDIVCPAVCVRGCFCRDGYIRNAYGVCTLPEECPLVPVCLQENEEYQSCGSSCPDNCDNYKDTNRICTKNCVAGCNCKAGYVRNLKDNTCIKPDECPSKECTGENEKLNRCASYCPVTCANRYTQGDWACITLCREACDCISGTLRNDNGTCVPVEQCTPPVCRQNEKYLKCGTACPLTCDSYKNPPLCTQQCVEDCFCEDGYVRDRYMRCVKPENCEPICPAGEKFNECSAHCQDTCENYNQTNRICTYQCQSGCVCAQGTVRRKDGQCVPPSECSASRCGINEIAVKCKSYLPQTCESIYTLYRPIDNPPCIPGCDCRSGYLRNSRDICVPSEFCPVPQNECGPNQEYKECGSSCEPSCADLDNPSRVCPEVCIKGCFCKDGYRKDDQGNCVTRDQCPLPVCKKPNEVAKDCGSYCEIKTCEDYNRTDIVCPAVCVRGCFCRDGYVRNAYGVCTLPEDCPLEPVCLQENEEYQSCGSSCPDNCDNYKDTNRICTTNCVAGCNCKAGYVRNLKDNTCIKPEQCPLEPVCLQENEEYQSCGSSCPDNCDNYKDTNRICTKNCVAGCNCKAGYVRNLKDNTCIKPEQCPISTTPCADPNAIKKKCASHESCRATCAVPNSRVCPKICIIDGCECKRGYVLSVKGGKCVQIEECPQQNVTCNGDPNAVIKASPQACPSTCDLPNGIPNCLKLGLDVGCECKPGYIKSNEDGKCVLPDQCKGGNPCGANATFAWCRVNCPNNYCPVNDNRGIIACDPPRPCPSGCICKLNYRRKSAEDDRCILASTCPPVKCSRPNEIWDPCPSACLRENCADVNNQPTTCNTLVLNWQPQCVCKKGHFRNDKGICIPAKDCPGNQPCDDPNAERLECAPAPSCRSTCARPNPSPCIQSCAVNQCVCKKGFVLSENGGKCIPVDECPKDAPCDGDSNAVIKVNPIPCPSTCAAPNASPLCRKYAPPIGCECKPGYLLAEDGRKCIKPDECPGGNPCGANSTFVWCRAGCPSDYCPADDSRGIIACDPPQPCPNGCICKLNYKRKSVNDNTCILSSTCPPVKCTRPNEIWDPCPSECRRESCADVNNQPTTCNTLVLNCQPQCVCKKGYFRNESDICVPAKECPGNQPCDDPNAERLECAPAPSCRSTCAKPNPSPCILSCAVNQCVCKKGFVLSENGGKCIPVDQCPKDAPCNGDSNAVIKANPIPCPSTCGAPNASPWCKKYAPPVGCECKPGYLLTEDGGKCIQPDECPGGNPCGKNATFVWCSFNCPTNNCPVNDNRAIIACSPPYPCPNGCACKLNHRRRSNSDSTCILASDCPPVDCTRPNEVWSPCPSACLRESCEDVGAPPATCNTLVLNCQPKCICKKGYFRNDTDICVPSKQCPKNQLCSDPNAERVQCAPAAQCRPTCAERNPGPCIEICVIDDCVCKNGFVLAEEGGNCIPEDQCPAPLTIPDCGTNEHYETNSNKCELTCTNYKLEAVMGACQPISACICNKDFVRDENGLCIRKETCPPPRCNENESYTSCGTACPATCQNRGDNCTACTDQCVEGCFCNKGFVRANNGTCVKPKDCPQRTCSDPNEIFDPCPPTCPATDSCSNIWSKMTCTNTVKCCKPQCRCKSGYFRNDKCCVPSSQC